MGFIQKDAIRTTIISYAGLLLGYLNKGILFILILSTEQIGLVNLILSVGILFAQLSNLGTINAISKFLPFFKDNHDQKRSFFRLNLLLVFGGLILFTLVLFLLQNQIIALYSAKSKLFVDYYFWIIPIGIANVFFLVFEIYLRSLFKNILSILVYEFILRLSITILLIFLWLGYINFDLFFILHCLAYFIPTIILFIYLIRSDEIRLVKNSLKISRKFKKIIFSYSIYSYSNSIGALAVMTMDALMIAYFLGLNETGVYTTIIYLISAIQIPYKSIIRIANPLVPHYWKEKNMVKMKELYRKVSSISLIIGLYLFLIIWCNKESLFSFLKPEYHSGMYVFLFLMIGRLNDMYFGINMTILTTSKKYKYDILFTFVLLVLVFTLNFWLIPIYGSTGAAISTGFAIVFSNYARMIFVYKAFKLHPFEKNQFYIMALFILIIALFNYSPIFISNRFVSIFLNSSFITILFLAIIILLKWNEDLNLYFEKIILKVFNKRVKLY